jgi:CHAT domain-containing protein
MTIRWLVERPSTVNRQKYTPEPTGRPKRWLRDFVDSTGRQPFAHPTYWSSFMLIGDPF